jgi:hypothetical protein
MTHLLGHDAPERHTTLEESSSGLDLGDDDRDASGGGDHYEMFDDPWGWAAGAHTLHVSTGGGWSLLTDGNACTPCRTAGNENSRFMGGKV